MQVLIENSLYLLAGVIFSNGIPHMINGLSGRYWPKNSRLIPGVENAYRQKKFGSSPVANFLWGMINLVITFLIVLGIGRFNFTLSLNLLCLLAGLLVGGVYVAWNFTEKDD